MGAGSPDFEPWLSRWGLVADGWAFSTPYTRSRLLPVRRGDEAAMLKIAGGQEEARGAALMAWWNGQGGAPVLAHEGAALLMARAADADGLVRMAYEGADEAADRILCEVAERLHARRPEPAPELVPLRRWFRGLERAAAGGGVFARAWAVVEPLLAAPRDERILHGDITHQNVLDFGAAGWRAIDPKGLIGERGYDFANLFRNPTLDLATPDRIAAQLERVSVLARLDRERLLGWVIGHGALSAAWGVRTGYDVGRALAFVERALALSEARAA